jgi:hypothetical protein
MGLARSGAVLVNGHISVGTLPHACRYTVMWINGHGQMRSSDFELFLKIYMFHTVLDQKGNFRNILE